MSETPSERPQRRRPKAESTDDVERQRAARQRTKQKAAAPRGAAEAPLIKVASNAESELTFVDSLKAEAKTGLPGLLVSFALHAVILLVLAALVIHGNLNDESGLNFGWISNAKESTDANEFVAKAVKIESIKINTPKKDVANPKTKDTQSDNSIARPVKPVDTKRSLVARTEEMKVGALDKVGNKDAVQRALTSGLAWVVRQQKTGGNWKLDSGYPDPGIAPVFRTDTGATALALLALLGDGHTPFEGQYKDAVANGLKWLRSNQKVDGDFLDDTELGRQVAFYVHSQATIAICEAYAMTQDRAYRESAEKAVQFLIDSQHPTEGGWRYQPQDADSMGDMSVTSWAAMALHSARMANIDVPPEVFGRVSRFVDSVQENNGARYKYLPSDSPGSFSPAMTAGGLLARQWMGWEKDDPSMQDGVRYLMIAKYKPEWGSKRNVYEWYYVAQTLHNIGGPEWKEWFNQTQTVIVENQRRRGSRKAPDDVLGSWAPNDPPGSHEEYADKAGRLYLTTMCLLILETPYRHYPIYASPAAE